MILDFYKLKEKPFDLLANPRFMYLSEQYLDTKSKLMYFLKEKSASLYLYGAVGGGKTSLLKLIAGEIENDKNVNAKYLIAPNIKTSNQLLRSICELFDVPTSRSYQDNIKNIVEFLVSEFKEGRYPLLLIDEAQNLTRDELKLIHLLLNYTTDTNVLLMIVLVGQPELAQRIDSFSSLKSRLISSSISEMTREDCEKMIKFRWAVASGGDSTPPFTKEAYDSIYSYTKGNPRETVKLCEMALIKGALKELTSIDKNIIDLSIKEL